MMFFDLVINQKFKYNMSDINVVQYLWNFAQLKEIKKLEIEKTKITFIIRISF